MARKPTIIHASRELLGRKRGHHAQFDRCAAISGTGQCRRLFDDSAAGGRYILWDHPLPGGYAYLCEKHADRWTPPA